MKVRIFSFIAAVCISGSVAAQELPPPCGTVVRSTRLKSDCRAPLIIGADNIKIDLNGQSILCQKSTSGDGDSRGIVLEGRRRVVVRDGRVACQYALVVTGGGDNSFTGLHLNGERYENSRAIDMSNTSANSLHNIHAHGGYDGTAMLTSNSHRNKFDLMKFESMEFSSVVVQGNNNILTRSSVDMSDDIGSGIAIVGNGNIVERSTVNARTSGFAISLRGNRGVLRRLNVQGSDIGLRVVGDDNLIERNNASGLRESGIAVTGEKNRVRQNTALGNLGIDLVNYSPVCEMNTWTKNNFGTDTDGDGPGAGCIR